MPEQEEEYQAPLYAFHLTYRPRNIATIFVTEDMIGHKLGEFAPTRTFKGHGHHTERSSALK